MKPVQRSFWFMRLFVRYVTLPFSRGLFRSEWGEKKRLAGVKANVTPQLPLLVLRSSVSLVFRSSVAPELALRCL